MARECDRKASSLTAPSTTAHLLWSGMTTSRGARVWCTIVRATSLYAVGTETRHDAVMRIGSKLRGGGPILHNGMRAVVSPGTPATSNRHRRPVANRADRYENRQAFLCDLPFNVRDGGRRPGHDAIIGAN